MDRCSSGSHRSDGLSTPAEVVVQDRLRRLRKLDGGGSSDGKLPRWEEAVAVHDDLAQYERCMLVGCARHTNSYWDEIQAVQWVRYGDFYDLHVPGWHHYSAAGLWHHNSGKSKVGAYDLLQRARDGRTYMVTGPTYKVLGQATIRTFVEVAREFGRLVRVTRSTENPSAIIRLAPPRCGLAEILFRSTENPDHLRGPNLSGVWMDEASLSPLEAYQILRQRLREKSQLGWLSATFTPRGLGHWTYQEFGQEPPRPGVFLVHAATRENPFLPPEYLALAESTYAGLRAEQELGGRFVSVAGAEWPPSYFHDALWFHDWPASGWQTTAMALDPSKGAAPGDGKPKEGRQPDYSAFVWGGVTRPTSDRAIVWVDADLDNVRDTTRMVADGLRHYQEFRPRAWVTEINGFQSLLGGEIARQARDLRLFGLPLYGINNSEDKRVRIRSIGPYLAKSELRFRDTPGCRLLVAQLRDFPFGEFDDGPDSLEMLLRMLKYLILGEQEGRGQPQLLRA